MCRSTVLVPLLAALTGAWSAACAQTTSTAITAADLRQRLFALAHDSMGGREPGYVGNHKAVEYIAAEFKRVGLQPAGDSGSWFQTVPFFWLRADTAQSLVVDGQPLRLGSDVAPMPYPVLPRSTDGATVVYGGAANDPATWIDTAAARGRIVVLSTPAPDGNRANTPLRYLRQIANARNFSSAALVCVVAIEAVGSSTVAQMLSGRLVQDTTRNRQLTPVALVSLAAAERLVGASLTGLKAGTEGKKVTGGAGVGIFPLRYPARNVVAVLPGSDPSLRGQYVSLTAHNDHVGYDRTPVDHDSLRAWNRVMRPMGADSPPTEPNAQQASQIKQILDSLRAKSPARPDSIRNGADDDGSGTVALLEIAERVAKGPKPKRSILFVSHTAEEYGLLGSQWFTDHATVPIDSLVAEIDMDMIGRGSKADLPEAGPAYLEVVGLRRLSKEFGDVVERANARQPQPFQFNLTYDEPGHPLQYYCRADHYSYGRYGIPAIAVSRGEHLDYHQVTDEPQYIDYDALARVATFVHDAALDLANLPHRPKLDAPKGDPHAPCRQ